MPKRRERQLETTMLGEPVPGPDDIIAGRYRLLALVGSGGMGRVYRALDLELNDVIALKVLRADLDDEPAALERFVQETRLARRVTHRNVARTFDIGAHRGLRFLTMEYVEGLSLAALLEGRSALPEARVAALGRAILEGLAAAHAAGVVHRDLKPDNVIVATDGRVVLTDFGIARDTSSVFQTAGRVIGTPAYMAPEQVEGARDLDARVDVYAFGEIAYELITGLHVWPGESFAEIVSARLTKEPPDPRVAAAVSDAIARVVLRCIARRREDRYRDARETLAAWDAATSGNVEIANSSPRPSRVEGIGTSVAVLPIRNLGGEGDAFLAEGVTEDLIDALSMTPNLRVRPRGMVARFAARDVDAREAGSALAVEAVVEASLRRTPSGVRLSARLLGVADGFQLWARRFDCAIGELLVASDEAARAIAEALAARLDAPARKAPTDGSAVETYLRARASLRRNWYTRSSEPLVLFREALDRAPEDALILSGFATARTRYARTPTELAEARALAQRAIVAGPHLGEPWIAMATLHRHAGDPVSQVAALARAFAASPRHVEVHYQLGRLFLEVGPIERARDALELAASLDPGDDEVRAYLAAAHSRAGDVRAAEAVLAEDGSSSRSPHLFPLVKARMRLWGQRAPATIETTAPVPRAYVELVEAVLTKGCVPASAKAELIRALPRADLAEQLLAELYLVIGDLEQAHGHAAGSVTSGLIDIVWFDVCPLVEAARAEPWWSALRAEVARRADAVQVALDREGFMSAAMDREARRG